MPPSILQTSFRYSSVRLWKYRYWEFIRQSWTISHTPFIRFCYSTQRALLTNLTLLRHPLSIILRHLRDKYPSLQVSLNSGPSAIFQAQKILLGGCLISSAQDKISDEELENTLKGFSLDHSLDYISACPVVTPSIEHTASDQPVFVSTSMDKTDAQTNRFVNPPLTQFVRQIRMKVHQFTWNFLHPHAPQPDYIEVVPDDMPMTSEPSTDALDANKTLHMCLKSVLSNLDFHPDGTRGFVDESWDLVIDQPTVRVWRRPLEVGDHVVPRLSGENGNGSSETAVGKSKSRYEYRLCGSYTDVSALSFLEVQLNLCYRRYWDNRIIRLEYVNPINGQNGVVPHTTSTDFIRWVARFPFPLASREYIYLRRWWLEPQNSDPQSPDAHQSRHAIVLSRSVSARQAESLPIKAVQSTGKWTDCMSQSSVRVTNYRSQMLIRSHGDFNKRGMDYYLIYYDDPRLPVGDSTLSIVSGKAMNQFISQLHDAALKLTQNGLPDGIEAVLFPKDRKSKPKQPPIKSTSLPSTPAYPPERTHETDVTSRNKSRFFTDYKSEPKRFSTSTY